MTLHHLYTQDGRKAEFEVVPFGMSLPEESGIYAVFSADRLLYIGRADDLDERSGSGIWNHEKALLMTMMGAQLVGYLQVANTFFRDELEAALISRNMPPLNDKHNALARELDRGPKNNLLGGLFN